MIGKGRGVKGEERKCGDIVGDEGGKILSSLAVRSLTADCLDVPKFTVDSRKFHACILRVQPRYLFHIHSRRLYIYHRTPIQYIVILPDPFRPSAN